MRIALTVYAPTLFFSIGTGAVIPFVPQLASDRGATIAVAAFVAGCFMIGELLADLPASDGLRRFGEPRTMIAGCVAAATGIALMLVDGSLPLLCLGLLLVGAATAVFGLARHAFLTATISYERRAGAMSLLAGVLRSGNFFGPMIGAWLSAMTGRIEPVLLLSLACVIAAGAVLCACAHHHKPRMAVPGAVPKATGRRLAQVLSENRTAFRTLGPAIAGLAALRAGRQVMLPTWALLLGLPAAQTALVIGVGAGIELALFYLSAVLMNRFGRRTAALPCTLGFAASYLVLALSVTPTHALLAFVIVTVLMALVNAGAGGIMMTLGADLAPTQSAGEFLALWRFISDSGQAAAPIALSAITAATSLGVAAGIGSGVAVLAAFGFARGLPRRAAVKQLTTDQVQTSDTS